MKHLKKTVAIILALILTVSLAACGGSDSGSKKDNKLTIAYQYGMAYAPLQVMKEQKLIEKYYDGVEIEWSVLNSGSAINEGFAGGSIDVGAVGVGPAITGITSGVPYKICSNVSAQPHKVMTNNPNIKSLKDIKDEKIALVNIGSFQHIVLAMAAKEQLGDAHALDTNIVAMSHPDGMSSLLSGSVECQLTTSPYVFKEAAEKGISEVNALESVWPSGNSFIVAVASTSLQKDNPELYDAVVKAFADAIDYLNNNTKEAAEMLCEAENVDAATMEKWLKDKDCVYSTETKGLMDFANFMSENDFLENDGPKDISDLVFDNVKGN
ncbi:NrtA/SsuA/CpmA family ABC transporter substrate-binding protein [Anaerovorax odorimutans]|uniref:NrtA/SsuA/CpmA family ABC transporter substrate-binding protein n=1 Tax=Anaerovorax odorimutans TaxID=109327 RepID=A0ABT1RJA1_9FIRM|nr:NrtA/SsuA/CpmA family ABC transporter substrate-binding protein [Anaerovorax odorimutans]MCQ4635256.1 NrtA/SsuA/CpmA family ABC transporter substrate-binding protein [Anaerovorax odorimutans]